MSYIRTIKLIKPIIMNNMTRDEAKNAMRLGLKVTHTTFTDREWVSGGLIEIITEDGCRVSAHEFWQYRMDEAWDSGWSIFGEANLADEITLLVGSLNVKIYREKQKYKDKPNQDDKDMFNLWVELENNMRRAHRSARGLKQYQEMKTLK